jgi:hypothetical protein
MVDVMQKSHGIGEGDFENDSENVEVALPLDSGLDDKPQILHGKQNYSSSIDGDSIGDDHSTDGTPERAPQESWVVKEDDGPLFPFLSCSSTSFQMPWSPRDVPSSEPKQITTDDSPRRVLGQLSLEKNFSPTSPPDTRELFQMPEAMRKKTNKGFVPYLLSCASSTFSPSNSMFRAKTLESTWNGRQPLEPMPPSSSSDVPSTRHRPMKRGRRPSEILQTTTLKQKEDIDIAMPSLEIYIPDGPSLSHSAFERNLLSYRVVCNIFLMNGEMLSSFIVHFLSHSM